jgi:lipoate-protein ligase A
LAAPAGSPLAVDALALYRQIHGALVAALAGFGMQATLREDSSRLAAREPFLCFQRQASGDVLIGETKIAGSAQRRRRGALLQHGSLLLHASPAAPEVAGICDLTARTVDENALRIAWQAAIARRLEVRLTESQASNHEQARANQLMCEKYATTEWNEKR